MPHRRTTSWRSSRQRSRTSTSPGPRPLRPPRRPPPQTSSSEPAPRQSRHGQLRGGEAPSPLAAAIPGRGARLRRGWGWGRALAPAGACPRHPLPVFISVVPPVRASATSCPGESEKGGPGLGAARLAGTLRAPGPPWQSERQPAGAEEREVGSASWEGGKESPAPRGRGSHGGPGEGAVLSTARNGSGPSPLAGGPREPGLGWVTARARSARPPRLPCPRRIACLVHHSGRNAASVFGFI